MHAINKTIRVAIKFLLAGKFQLNSPCHIPHMAELTTFPVHKGSFALRYRCPRNAQEKHSPNWALLCASFFLGAEFRQEQLNILCLLLSNS